MIKAIIFDLDGVLVDAREIHYESLNNALARHNYTITREEHLSTFDGLSTKKKLAMLTEKKGLSPELYEDIWRGKQEETFNVLRKLEPDHRIIEVLKRLKESGLKVIVCSNSIRESTKLMLLKKGFMEYIDFFLSNEETVDPKPSPEIYLRAMVKLRLKPNECLIVEDSHIGRQAAFDSGGHLCGVEDSSGVTYERIINTIDKANKKNKSPTHKIKWQTKNMNIVIPLAGDNPLFKNLGYSYPKPLIEINGKPMIQLVVENLNTEGRFIFIVKKEISEQYNLRAMLNLIAPGCEVIEIEGSTEGAVASVLLAKEHIDNDAPLVIANSDQFLEWNSNEFFYAMAADECDGGIVTFKSTHPKWSYIKLKEDGFVGETAEKKPISNIATAGIYFYKKGSDFIKYAEQMMVKEMRVNGKFYVAPVYNEMVLDNKKIRSFDIPKIWGLKTPEDLDLFLNKCDLIV